MKKKFFKTKDECEVTFEHTTDAGQKVALVSEANGWQPVEMKKRTKDGAFVTRVRLPKEGQFQFRYLIDEQTWENDTAADGYVANEFGGQNSIVDTTPSQS